MFLSAVSLVSAMPAGKPGLASGALGVSAGLLGMSVLCGSRHRTEEEENLEKEKQIIEKLGKLMDTKKMNPPKDASKVTYP